MGQIYNYISDNVISFVSNNDEIDVSIGSVSTSWIKSIFTNGDIEIDIGWCPDQNEIIIGARPEDLTICKASKDKRNNFAVSSVLPNGPEVIVQLIGGSTNLLARVNHDVNLQQGELMEISFDKKALNIYDAETGQLINGPES